MARCVRVPKAEGEAARTRILEAGLLDTAHRIGSEDGHLLIPVTADVEGMEMCEAELRPQERPAGDYRELLELPDGLSELLPSSFDVVGDVGMIKLPDELLPYKGDIGSAMMRANHSLRCVYIDSGVKGELRVRDLELIAGTGPSETVHREFGARMHTDPAKVYFNPRLAGERHRIASQVRDGEVVIDMFAGVAPFGVQICRAAKPSAVYSIDLNPEAERFALMNKRDNRCDALVPITGDATVVVPTLPMADRVVMNLPQIADRFLPLALGHLNRGGTVHLYKIIERDAFPSLCEEMAAMAAEEGHSISLETSELKTYSPTMSVYSIDVRKLRSVALERVQRDAGLALVVAAPLRVVLQGLRVQCLEHHLAEPLAYRDLDHVVARVVCPERQGALESGVDLPECSDAPLPYPGRPHPELGADVLGHPDPLHRGHVEHGPWRDSDDALPLDLRVTADRDLRDPEVVAVGGEPLLDEVPDADVPGHQALHDVPVR